MLTFVVYNPIIIHYNFNIGRYDKTIILEMFKKYRTGFLRLLICIGGVVLVYLIDYQCIFLKYLHIPCLGCGMSRAWKCVIMGQWQEAIEYHRAFWTIPFLGIFVWKGGCLFKNNKWNIVVITIIVISFVENYLHHFL